MGATTDQAVTIRMSEGWLWLIRLGGGALGCAVGFGAGPVLEWLLESFGAAPGPLRIVAGLPPAVAVPVLTAVGLGIGVWVAMVARKESPQVTVDGDHISLLENGSSQHVRRDRVGSVFTDGRDLVVLAGDSGEVARVSARDLSTKALGEALERFGYPWRGTTDPHEPQFTAWSDGTPDLDDTAHRLFRERRNALTDKRTGAAADALDRLREHGLAVRDRDGGQQYRVSDRSS